jgi:hypothetical protein
MIKKRRAMLYALSTILLLIVLYYLNGTLWFIRVASFAFSLILFYLIDKFFNFRFKASHYLIFLFIITAGFLMSPLYHLYPNYDKLLHLTLPFFASILIFYLVNRGDMELWIKLFLTFTIVITMITFFEIAEFVLDWLFNLKTQGVFLRSIGSLKLNMVQDENTDTMIDLILGMAGALSFSILKIMQNGRKRLIKKKKK